MQVRYASGLARVLDWLLFCWPLNWLQFWQGNVMQAVREQYFADAFGEPVVPLTVRQILRGPTPSACDSPSLSSPGESK